MMKKVQESQNSGNKLMKKWEKKKKKCKLYYNLSIKDQSSFTGVFWYRSFSFNYYGFLYLTSGDL